MEMLGDDPTNLVCTYHWGSPSQASGTNYQTGVDLSQGFHTYGIDWQPDHLTWYFDGKAVKTLTSSQAAICSDPMYLILDVWLGGWHGGTDSTTQCPATMDVDYVRVWQKTP
jgi:beta-glucanase (GH16 family)